ncbi:domain of Kin17 curved DNA-binding protein-domain-containing protein [Aspergillus californicus]
MPRAEAGSTKALGNKMKAKGLGRLRWYCQACERQMRDENGFKCHVQSESHVRQVLLIGEDPKKYIEDFSRQFIHNFMQLLRTTHGEKKVNVNQFYQQVIADKEHIHMNATKWKSLSQFAAQLGREGLVHVEETEKGLFVSYIDRTPEAMRRREAVMKKERQDRGDEEREQKEILEQVARARGNVEDQEDDIDPEARNLQRKEGEKVKLNIGLAAKPARPAQPAQPVTEQSETPPSEEKEKDASATPETAVDSPTPEQAAKPAPKVSMSFGAANGKPKNVFASAKKNPLAGKKGSVMVAPKKMSEQERIMKQEMEAMQRKRLGGSGMPNPKRPRVS